MRDQPGRRSGETTRSSTRKVVPPRLAAREASKPACHSLGCSAQLQAKPENLLVENIAWAVSQLVSSAVARSARPASKPPEPPARASRAGGGLRSDPAP